VWGLQGSICHTWEALSGLLGERLMGMNLKHEEAPGCGGPWAPHKSLDSLPKAVGGLLQDMSPRMT
jgi:hypothetical protein